jgi:hypothetical protein
MKNIAVAAAVVAMLVTPSYAQTLDQIVDRMSEYLLFYEQQLREVVADERYTQQEYVHDAMGFKRPWHSKTLQSEVAFLRLPDHSYWYGVRDTKAVDGKPLGTNGLHIADLVSAADWAVKAAVIMAASSEQNIGTKRNINMPTVPLEVIQSWKLLTFSDDGGDRIRGLKVRRLEFDEVGESTLIRANGDGFRMKTHGRVWVEPATGRVWCVELDSRDLSNPRPQSTSVTVRIDFGMDSKLGFLVPIEMFETFPGDVERGDGHAIYSNFRKFQTSARIVPQ